MDLTVELRNGVGVPLDLELTARCGEVLALIGPSGAGKSTLLRAIAGLFRPGHGRIACGGEVWLDTDDGTDRPAHQRRVGMVFQSFALFPHLSAMENVTCALGQLPRQERAAAARSLLARVRLEGLEDRKPASLSGGQQQRVALARALAREPSALLLDEPFAAVDRRTRRALHLEVQAVRQERACPVLLVTHDIDEALTVADRIAVMDHGRILQVATPQALLGAPVSELVADLLDLPHQHRNGPGLRSSGSVRPTSRA